MEPAILYEDDDLFVIDKPAGMTVNKAETTKGELTIQEWLEGKFTAQFAKFKTKGVSDFYQRAGIVHRLDKETSGVLLVAKTPTSFTILQQQFKDRVIKKTYLALVHGRMVPEVGEISVPIGRLSWNRKRFGVVAGGREALTSYKTIGKYYSSNPNRKEEFALLEVNPKTGRTHQIRVHLKYSNHPIFSDFLYTGRKTAREDRKVLPRFFLHATSISFTHPTMHNTKTITSQMPKDLSNFLETLIERE